MKVVERLKEAWKRLPKLMKAAIMVFVIALASILGGGVLQPASPPIIEPETPPVSVVTSTINRSANYFDNRITGSWELVGAAPYLFGVDEGSYVNCTANLDEIGDWHFEDLPAEAQTIQSVTIYVRLWEQIWPLKFEVHLWDGTSWVYVGDADTGGTKSKIWTWWSLNVTSTLDTVDKVNNVEMKLITNAYGTYESTVDAAFLEVIYGYSVAPSYKNAFVSRAIQGLSSEFVVTWSVSGATLSHYIFSWNGSGSWTNETYAFSTGVSKETVTVTKTMPNASIVSFKWYANSSDGLWSSTSQINCTLIDKAPITQYPAEIADETTIESWKNVYYEGAIYIVYLNSLDSNYYIKAYDIAKREWTPSFEVGNVSEPDAHWRPAVGVMPNGSIIVVFGYYSPIYYRLTTQSADVQSNLTSLLSSWTEQRVIPDTSPEAVGSGYPNVVTIKGEKLLVFYRWGDSFNGNWTMSVFNGTAWEPKQELIQNNIAATKHTMYLYWWVYDRGYILATGWKAQGETPPTNEDVLFFYSDDNATTWKTVNGTTLTLPFDVEDVTVWDTAKEYSATSSCLDASLRPVIFVGTTDPDYDVLILTYNTSIGNVGVFSSHVPIDEIGEKITVGGSLFLDYHYNLPSFYCQQRKLIDSDTFLFYNITKYVRLDNDSDRWIAVDTFNKEASLGYQPPIEGAKKMWDLATIEQEFAMGYPYAGSEWLSGSEIYGTKFVAEKTVKIHKISIRPSEKFPLGTVAIYNGTFYRLAVSEKITLYQGKYGWGGLPIQPAVQLEAGKTYYLCIDAGGIDYSVHATTGDVNQTFSYPETDDFPEQLNTSTLTWHNKKLSIVATTCYLVVRGYEFKPLYSNIGYNNTVLGFPTQFSCYWKDQADLGLSHAILEHNNTGQIQQEVMAFSGEPLEAWSNFTLYLNDTVDAVVAFRFHCNNTIGSLTITPWNYLKVTAHPLDVGWNNYYAINPDVGHTLLEVNASLHLDSINFTVITFEYPNGTQVSLVWIQETDDYWVESTTMTVTSDAQIWIYCNEEGKWYHKYGA